MKSILFLGLLAVAAFVVGCGDSKPAATGSQDASGPITEAKLGVKIYPGATIVTSGETDEVVSANLRTSDPVQKVVAFYEAELGAKASGDSVTYQISGPKGGKTYAIAINNDGPTNVSIMGKK
jgi:hypothetical protein